MILFCMLVSLPLVSWFVLDWTDAGCDEFPGGVVIRDASGEALRVTLGPGDEDCRPGYVADPEDWIVKALVASEDGTFWEHHGVRPLSALRAAFQNLFYRRRVSGASTLSMQTVRLIAPHPKSLLWKWREAFLALKMERKKDKRWILTQYLNRVSFGSNFVGVEAASQGWFGHDAKSLSLGEAALLAGLVQSPSFYRPDRHLDRALKRRDYVLGRMRELDFITEEECLAAVEDKPTIKSSPRPFVLPHFCDWVIAEKKRETGRNPVGEIRTALRRDLQAKAQQEVDATAERLGCSSAALVLSVKTGEMLAMAVSGSYADSDGGQVNTALAPRPAGSTLKPFLAACAMDRGFVTPDTRLLDAPVSYHGYRPANFDGKYRGRVTLSDSLVLSLNIPFVRLLQEVGVETFTESLNAFGFRRLDNAKARFGLGLAIGNAEITLLELARAARELACGESPVVSREAAYLVSDILSGDERSQASLGHVADVETPRFAWKTGTSSAFRDAWAVAWNPEYVIAVWCGHKRGGFGDRSLEGAKAAAPVAWSIARYLYPQQSGPWFECPKGIVMRKVCAETGEPLGPACPEATEGRAITGLSSPKLCALHRLGADGLRETRDANPLRILKPEPNAIFKLVDGIVEQRIVVEAIGGDPDGELVWFVDGKLKREEHTRRLVLELSLGTHVITVTNVSGESASVSLTVIR